MSVRQLLFNTGVCPRELRGPVLVLASESLTVYLWSVDDEVHMLLLTLSYLSCTTHFCRSVSGARVQ